MRIYATTEDLTNWITPATAPDNAASLLRSASTLIENRTVNAIYDTDADGYPESNSVRVIFRDATCAQAHYWAVNDLDPAAGPTAEFGKRQAISKNISGASIGYSVSLIETGTQSRVAALTGLAPETYSILNNVGLLNGIPVLR